MTNTIRGKLLLTAALIALPVAFATPLYAADTGDQGSETQFANVIDDLPLMPGLQLVDDEDVLFDEPGSGRIAETNAVGSVDIGEVYKFYQRSLPHLGWKAVNAHTYERGSEMLHIDAKANNKVTTVTFTVKPAKQ